MSLSVEHGGDIVVGYSASFPIILSSDSDSKCSSTEPDDIDSTNKSKVEKKSVHFEKSIVDQSVGYVGELEDIGDADYSDGDDNGEDRTHNTCNSTTTSMKCSHGDYYHTIPTQVKAEQRAFTKLLKPYNVGLFLLPDLLRDEVFDVIEDGYCAIANDGYTAFDAMSYLHETVGKLYSNTEVRKIFLKETLLEDMDG